MNVFFLRNPTMKTHLSLASFGACLALLLSPGVRAETAPAVASSPAPTRELAVVVVESLERPSGAIDDFVRIDMAFTELARQRKWPVKIKAERLAANLPKYETELRTFYQGVRSETPGELTFRAWVTLTSNDVKKDFGIVLYRYPRRIGEAHDVMLERIFRGAANAIADKIEPVLFPKSAVSNP